MQHIHICFGAVFIKIKVLHPVTLRSTSHYSDSGMEQNDTDRFAHSFSWQFTDSKAGSGPDRGGAVQASGPVEEDPAFVVVGVLSEQATYRD